jgi:hypothetical protein
MANRVDCGVPMVDAPVSEVELALLPESATAGVVPEGERRVRHDTVPPARGATSTLGQADP